MRTPPIAVLCALPLVAVLSVRSVAHADRPCAAEAEAARAAGLDPSLAAPTDRTAVAHMRTASVHLDEGMKRAAVVATRDQAAAEYQAAIDAYVAAAMISSAPVILYNLAHSYRTAADYPHAIEQYRLFLDRGKPGAPLRALIECHIATMTAELDRAAASAPPTKPAPVDESLPIKEPPSALAARARWHQDTAGWAITGAGLATVGVGAYLLRDAHGLRTDALDEASQVARRDLRAKADDRQTWGTVATVAGAAILAAGVVKLVLTPDTTEASNPRLAFSVGPGGIVVGGWF